MIKASRFFRLSGHTALALAAGSLLLAAPAARLSAQAANQPAADVPAPAAPLSTTGLNLPENPEFFGKNDPNNRKATAVVNGEIITGTDVDHRLALVVGASNTKPGPEELGRLRLQVLRNLIDETLQIQEAAAAKIEVSNAEVEETFERVATQNFGRTPAAVTKYLHSVGSSPASLKRQIKGELAWQRLLRRNVQPFINVSESEVKEVMARLAASKGTEEYRLGEIFLAASDQDRAQVEANALKIVEQLKQGGSFVGYARQYSQASTAAVGGDLGWLRLAQLPTELAAAAQGLSNGQLVGPVPLASGFSILYLIDKRQVLTSDPRDAILSLKQISIDFPKGTTKAVATDKAKQFSAMIQSAKGCGTADEAAQTVGATVVQNDQVRARDLPPALQDMVLGLSVGQSTPPFGSLDEGVRVLMICGRDDPPAANGPSFDQIMSQMEDDRVNKRAQAYLRDLRRDAVIEYN